MNFFLEKLIKINKHFNNKNECFHDMIKTLNSEEIFEDVSAFSKSIFDREAIMSTGFGRGIGLPHGRGSFVKELKVLVYILDRDLEFMAIDDEPVNIIFMFAIPESKKDEYLKILKSVSNFLRLEKNRQRMIDSKSCNEIFRILQEIENEI